MPPFKLVPSLESTTLKSVAYMLRRLCYSSDVTVEDLAPVIHHLRDHLPPLVQATVCHTLLQDSQKIVFPELLNHKYLLLSTELNASYIWINNSRSIVPSLKKMVGGSVRTLKMTGGHDQLDFDQKKDYSDCEQVIRLEPLYVFIKTLTNLTKLKCIQMCTNRMLEVLSTSCPNLEDLSVEMCTDVEDIGVFYLAGHLPTQDTYDLIRRGGQVPSISVCSNKLKKVNLEYTLACSASAVMLLHLCPHIEELNVTPDVNVGDVFTSLHGSNPEKYQDVRARYSLKVVQAHMELNEDELALIVRTCPKLEEITLRCNGVERKDRNFLANLLRLNLKVLNVMNCNTEALLWYLKERGRGLTSLSINHLTMAPIRLTFTRTHLQSVIRYCPNLHKFILKLSSRPIQPDVPYASFGQNLSHFHSLSHLMVEGATITAEDLTVLVGQCRLLRELHILIHNLEMLEDQVLYNLLATGCLRNLWTLFLYRPMLTLAALKRLMDECPHLHTVGPLSSWAITKKDRMKLATEIREKNWDLNVESPEMMHMLIL